MALDLAMLDAPSEHPLKSLVSELVWHRHRNTPRHLQRAVGPSEVGEPCTRKLAYKIMGEPRRSHGGDPLPSIVGTAAHTWMDGACQAHNERIGRMRFITEATLKINGITGHCDCYDCDTGTVIDWKFPGATAMTKYRKEGPGELYRTQAHLYGAGWIALGMPVNEVAIVFLPRGGFLKDLHVWSEPFDPVKAEEALNHYYNVTSACVVLNVEQHPENYRMLPRKPGHGCTYCQWWTPGVDNGNSCPGYTEGK